MQATGSGSTVATLLSARASRIARVCSGVSVTAGRAAGFVLRMQSDCGWGGDQGVRSGPVLDPARAKAVLGFLDHLVDERPSERQRADQGSCELSEHARRLVYHEEAVLEIGRR